MPTGKGGKPEDRRGSKAEDRRGSNPVKRETFRPPWVKDDPDGLPPKPSNLWSKTRKNSRDGATVDGAEGSKKSDIVKATEPQENGTKEHIFVKPQLKPVPPKDTTKLQSREVKIPIKLNSVKKTKSIDEGLEKAIPPVEKNPIIRQDSLKKIGNIPRPPPIPPPAPKLPRPSELKPLSNKQREHIEALKNRPKVRPDWTSLLKEVESGAKLKHVQCNDRSKPLLPKAMDNDKNAFIYESEKKEKGTAHNKLLNEIQQGVSLKKTKTNDRSKPMLEGLRKFRRQMTIEEQIIKSQSMASIPPEEIPELVDELDDIDRVRDDLQSTKQMLAMELRNKEALARENKRIAARLAQLEAELEKEKANKKTTSVAAPVETDDKLVSSLKTEAAHAKKTAEDLEKKYNDASSQLDNTKTELEEVRKQKMQLEKKLMDSLQGSYPTDKRLSISDRKESIAECESEKEESCESDGGSDEEAKKERKALKEYKQFRNKLRSNKNKEDNAKKERMALKTQIKRIQQAIKDEKKKYKALKKEVNKMAALMKEVSDEEDEGEEKEPEEVEDEEPAESESESESESSETDSESEKSLSEAEDAPVEKKKANVVKRTKKHEGRLSALKKGNYILKTNVERLQDDLNKQKDLSLELQQDLDSVLSELG